MTLTDPKRNQGPVVHFARIRRDNIEQASMAMSACIVRPSTRAGWASSSTLLCIAKALHTKSRSGTDQPSIGPEHTAKWNRFEISPEPALIDKGINHPPGIEMST